MYHELGTWLAREGEQTFFVSSPVRKRYLLWVAPGVEFWSADAECCIQKPFLSTALIFKTPQSLGKNVSDGPGTRVSSAWLHGMSSINYQLMR